MVSRPGIPPSALTTLKLILSASNTYYAKVLPLYRKSLERRREKVRNPKGLQVKIHPARRAAAIIVAPWVCLSPKFPAPHPSINPRKRRASPAEPTVEPPYKKLQALTDATTIDIRTLNLVPLLKCLQDSLSLPTLVVLRHGRWCIIRQRGPVSLDEPPSIPEDLVTIKVPPGLKIGRTSK
ncbi:hypothetical protein BDM02DRAFT_3187909 [Thelephora ganbajun]|uniref:Uncharacterized protein n=1 Tax=Thelephora ganbajun TaxID=370292 RepID=A0ACB6ZDI7_THEGA|nr:hypothetical protein BDM02DRAFT_3187909 [Thelephora ganbajun]